MMLKQKDKEQNFVDFTVSVNRVTKVTKGGKRFGFSVFVVSGDQGGKVGIALGRGRDVASAIAKAALKARKNTISFPLRGSTIPYNVTGRHGSSTVLIRSAFKGTGLIAGGPVRAVMEAVGIKDVLAKSLGSPNPQNVVKAVLNGLAQLRSISRIAKLRGKSIEEITKGKNAESA